MISDVRDMKHPVKGQAYFAWLEITPAANVKLSDPIYIKMGDRQAVCTVDEFLKTFKCKN